MMLEQTGLMTEMNTYSVDLSRETVRLQTVADGHYTCHSIQDEEAGSWVHAHYFIYHTTLQQWDLTTFINVPQLKHFSDNRK